MKYGGKVLIIGRGCNSRFYLFRRLRKTEFEDYNYSSIYNHTEDVGFRLFITI
jgi:hypothetical protein